MNLRSTARFLLVFPLFAAVLLGGDSAPGVAPPAKNGALFQGYMLGSNGHDQFLVSFPLGDGTYHKGFFKINDAHRGWSVRSFDPKSEALRVVNPQGKTETLALAPAGASESRSPAVTREDAKKFLAAYLQKIAALYENLPVRVKADFDLETTGTAEERADIAKRKEAGNVPGSRVVVARTSDGRLHFRYSPPYDINKISPEIRATLTDQDIEEFQVMRDRILFQGLLDGRASGAFGPNKQRNK